MKVIFKDVYKDGSDLVISASVFDNDLKICGYDKEHRNLIVNAVYEKASRDGASFLEDELKDLWV